MQISSSTDKKNSSCWEERAERDEGSQRNEWKQKVEIIGQQPPVQAAW